MADRHTKQVEQDKTGREKDLELTSDDAVQIRGGICVMAPPKPSN